MKKCGVDFLGIGAQRAGTSWLWKNLKQHPGIWMPPRKELHYFDRSPRYPSSNLLTSSPLMSRLLGRTDRDKRFRRSFKRGLLTAVRSRNWERLHWNLHYYLGAHNDQWYRSLFKHGGDKIKGEITPAYSILELDDVKHIRSLFPEIKVILLLRNPMERAWSQVRFAWTRMKLKDLENLDAIREFLDAPHQSLRSDYMRTLRTWLMCLPREHMFIGFYDDIIRSPGTLISNILQFLEVDPIEIDKFPSLNLKVNVSREREMPVEVRYYLAKKYRNQIEQLSHFVGSYALAWLEVVDEILESVGEKTPVDYSQARGH